MTGATDHAYRFEDEALADEAVADEAVADEAVVFQVWSRTAEWGPNLILLTVWLVGLVLALLTFMG